MHRMGHGTMRAALIYKHASSDRDRRIAEQMSALVEAQRVVSAEIDDEDGGGSSGAQARAG
jgi:hypothetical protein